MSNYDDFALPEHKMDISETKVRDYYDPFKGVCGQDTIYYSAKRGKWYKKDYSFFKEIYFHKDLGYWSDESKYDCDISGVVVRNIPLTALQSRMFGRDPIKFDFTTKSWHNSNGQKITWSQTAGKWSDQ